MWLCLLSGLAGWQVDCDCVCGGDQFGAERGQGFGGVLQQGVADRAFAGDEAADGAFVDAEAAGEGGGSAAELHAVGEVVVSVLHGPVIERRAGEAMWASVRPSPSEPGEGFGVWLQVVAGEGGARFPRTADFVPIAGDGFDGRDVEQFFDRGIEVGEIEIALEAAAEFDVEAGHRDHFVQALRAVGFDRGQPAVVRHGQAVDKAGAFGGAGDGEAAFGQAPVKRGEGDAEGAAGLQAGAGLADIDRAAHLDAAELFRIALVLPAQHREFLVHPDVDAARPGAALELAAHDNEHFLVLHAHGVEQLGRIIAGGLPIGPDRRDRARIFVGQGKAGGEQGGDLGRVGAVFQRDQLARIVPRHRGHDAGAAGGGARVEQALERGGGGIGHGAGSSGLRV